ncbi:serine hydrolase [Sphaerimonospora cavernae]|uniref:Serine hydrolase n=1 Tax=Sphaerimonospora cavernae TaxID=1740611 RepID=A0ABV6UBX8_9ACTN
MSGLPDMCDGGDLPGRLAALAAGCPGTLAVCVSEVGGTGRVAGVNEDVELPLASTGKLLLLAAVARGVTDGELDPDEPLDLLEDDYAAGSGLLTALSARRWTIADLTLLTASVSDNTATNALLRRLGPDRVDAVAGALGLSRTRIHDRIREPRLPEHPPTFATGTARELAALAHSLAGSLAGSPGAGESWHRLMIGWMAHNTDRSLVPALLPHDAEDRRIPAGAMPYPMVWVANKTGTDTGTRADVGVLVGARRTGYAVLAHGRAGSEHALVRAIRQAGLAIAAAVHQTLSRDLANSRRPSS